ncbi:MAG TPA: hypothetical protein VKU38_18815 [Ktedonobacteraceae bacterium]|nr:hypothetical protein [Ktedonobacteraceae bacterium]
MKMVISHLQRYGGTKLLIVAILAIFVSAALVACGSSTTGSGGSATPTTQVQAQNCGTVNTNPRGLPTDVNAARQNEQCFYQAYQQCHNASLVFTLHGLDTSMVHKFTITNHNNQCIITDAMQHSIAPAPLSPAQIFQCSTMSLVTDGLHISGCGQEGNNGTIIVPSNINTSV